MINLKNELPIAVHIHSGGCARVRSGSNPINLTGISCGSFQVGTSSKFRLVFNERSLSGACMLIGYASPVTVQNASFVLADREEISDDVFPNTTVYFTLINPASMEPANGAAGDYAYVSLYE